MSQRLLAISFTFLMLASALPGANATHTDPLVPDLPILPQAKPTQECIPTLITPDVLARANALVAGDPAWYQDEMGVPSLCVNGRPLPQWVDAIAQANDQLERLRNLTREVQLQVDHRIEATLPEGALPKDLVEPKIVLLNETFDGRRNTGFGDWKVVTERGEDPAWELRRVDTLNGTRTTYRFGDDEGYEQGIHQWLVSPEIDLTALKANKTAIQDLIQARDLAKGWLRGLCYNGVPPQLPPVEECRIGADPIADPNQPGVPFVTDAPSLGIVLATYEMAFDQVIAQSPVMQHAASLDLTYKLNMANMTDGVRLWIYSGDRAPDRSVLFDPDFAKGAVGQSCVRDPVVPLIPRDTPVAGGTFPVSRQLINDTGDRRGPNEGSRTGNLVCTATLEGGEVVGSRYIDPSVGTPMPGMQQRVATFAFGAPDPLNTTAFSGHVPDLVTARLNLTDWTEQRIWILFEVKTARNDRGLDTFHTEGAFDRFEDYGFELARVFVEGDGYLRNFRLKDVGATFPYVVEGNEFGDDPRTVRTTVPPGNDSIVAYVHNAGDYTENATFNLVVTSAPRNSTAFVREGNYSERIRLAPDEVKILRIPWSRVLGGDPLGEDRMYRLSADLAVPNVRLTVDGLTEGLPDDLPPVTDPNGTQVRPANAAGTIPGAGVTSLAQLVRADTSRELTPVRLDGAFGVPLQFCRSLDGTTCDELYAAPKGEQRLAVMGVRNDGNTPQTIVADLIVELDGVTKSDIISEGARQTLRDVQPGETRGLTWTLTPTDPGAYRVAVALLRGDGTPEPLVERMLFSQRSTGLMCLDALDARECGPAFDGGLVPLLNNENITAAAFGADGTLYVATEMEDPNPDTGAHSGKLAALTPEGEWKELANLSREVLENVLSGSPTDGASWGDIRVIVPAPDGSLWLVGDNLTFIQRRANGDLVAHRAPPAAHLEILDEEDAIVGYAPVHYGAAAWFNGSLVAGGQFGKLVEITSNGFFVSTLTNRTLQWFPEEPDPVRYWGTIRALTVAPNGQLFLLGDDGLLLRRSPEAAKWSDVAVDGNYTAWALNGGSLRAAAVHDGRFYVVGEDALLVNLPGAYGSFTNATPPAPLQGLATFTRTGTSFFTGVASSHLGDLYVLDHEGRPAVCDFCADVTPRWERPELPLPTAYDKGAAAHPARPALLVGDGERTFILGEAGLVLELDRHGVYDNADGWTSVPALAPRDGGVIQTAESTGTPQPAGVSQNLIGLPDAAGQAVGDEAEKFRLFLNHSIRNATPRSAAEIHLVYAYFPSHSLGSTVNNANTCEPMTTQNAGVGVVCNHQRFRHLVTAITARTPSSDWEMRLWDNLPSASLGVPAPATGDAAGGAKFHGIEFLATKDVQWAIDDLHLQGYVDGKWRTVLQWRGPAVPQNGTFWNANTTTTVNTVLRPVPSGSTTALATLSAAPQWGITYDAPFALDTVSPWHISPQYADRPVFAANSEAFLSNVDGDCCATGAAPRLFNGWNSRLVSPVIDLRNAHDPVVTFDHLYAFRAAVYANDDGDQFVKLGDGGYLEVQYLKQGEECGSADVTATCGWSRFYPVQPDAGYPNKTTLGYSAMGYVDNADQIEKERLGQTGDRGRSYWGRLATPDETGFISAPRRTDEYVTERLTLSQASCTATELETLSRDPTARLDCVPVNLTGRQIRVAFHVLTTIAPVDAWNATDLDEANQHFNPTYPGEGWYINDFKVLGASKLGIDLVATNMTFRVGYDVEEIGVGPGTRVPVNVTVVNNGTFSTLGYTARLQVDRVLDRALKTTAPVETIPLAQQPVLEAGRRVNHTLYWNVPAEPEGAEYVLSFTVEPIGIDRDEDHLDNVARLGSTSVPVLAKTVRRFNTEFLVSPENATIDITRYIPMFINNTGNVPLDAFTVERRINVIGRSVDRDAQTCDEWRDFVEDGRPTAIVDCRTWETDTPAPPGARTPLTAISGDVSPSADLFWRAPERANFLVSVSAHTDTLTSGLDRRVSAFATYLFDDVEGGPRGESDSGNWNFSAGWAAAQPGFRSTDAYAFGDPLLSRYPADANDSIVSPTIDLGNARAASVGFFHKYRFETGFDAGIVEASIDGVNWSVVPVAADSLVRAGYNATTGFHVQPSSPIHPDGDPTKDDVRAFTGDSSLHPANVEGWVFSQLDLTDYAGITEPDLEYEAYSSLEIQSYAGNRTLQTNGRFYSDKTWCPGAAEDFRCWEIENIPENSTSPLGLGTPEEPNTFWWSGSANYYDDGKRPIQNHLLRIPISISDVQPGQVVTADWWEYASRFSETAAYRQRGQASTERWPDDLHSVYFFHNGRAGAETTRYNLGEAKIVERDGKWYHMRADVTPIVDFARASGASTVNVGFSYTPISDYALRIEQAMANPPGPAAHPGYDAGDLAAAEDPVNMAPDTATGTGYGAGHRYADSPGFAIDGFLVTAQTVVRGQPLGEPLVLADEQGAWDAKVIRECGTGGDIGEANNWIIGFPTEVACLDNNRPVATPQRIWIDRNPLDGSEGRNWNLVTRLPGPPPGWGVVEVRDHEDRFKLPTGDLAKAWYSGELPWDPEEPQNNRKCMRGPDPEGDALANDTVPCVSPGSESRLITPAFDLGRVAGTNAQLSFWHRYGFPSLDKLAGQNLPFATGGVVEYQEYDAQTGTWSEWRQLYDEGDPHYRGYSAITADVIRTPNGVHRFDPPFEDHDVAAFPDPVQYLYSGTRDWTQASFDIDELIGKRVRFGFHVAWSDWTLVAQGADTDYYLENPDESHAPVDRMGWWIADVGVVGDVIVGQPVQLRWRAGTDGNVHDGSWLVDDIGVFGARYRNNVGLFVDQTPLRFGAYNNTTETIPITIRNLGDGVRRNLAIEILNAKPSVELNFTVPGASVRYGKSSITIEGITLAPGGAKTLDLVVRAPRLGPDSTDLIMTLKTIDVETPGAPVLTIVDNEVQGMLSRTIGFQVKRDPEAVAAGASVRALSPAIGSAVEIDIAYRNDGYGPSTIDLDCKAETITGWEHVNHRASSGEKPIVVAEYPCELVSGALTIPRQSTMPLTYRVVPTSAGYLRVTFNGTVLGGGGALDEVVTGVQVGASPITYQMPFSTRRQWEENITITQAGTWDHLRGNAEPGALVVGIDENATRNPQRTYFECLSVCRATTEPIDLHNYSQANPAFLSFWHMDRLAKYDGARVVARVLQDEGRPNGESGWSRQCGLTPREGWEGHTTRRIGSTGGTGTQATTTPADPNAAFGVSPPQYWNNNLTTNDEYFVSDNGVWEETWDLEVFDLRQPCYELQLDPQNDNLRNPAKVYPLLGQTVRFEFEVMGGLNLPQGLQRGQGQGMLVDDISVGPLSVAVSPLVPQRANMLDNTTKAFHVLVRNDASVPDTVRLEYVAEASSAPEGSVRVPSEPVHLAPGESRAVPAYVTLPRDPSLLPTEFKVLLRARSVIDPNAAGDAVLNLDFAPRQWAEMSIAVEAPKGLVQEGTETFIPITIENNGIVDSVNTTIRITDTWAGGSSVIELPLASVTAYAVDPEGSTRVLEFRWRPEKGSLGEHTLTFELDPLVLGEEYTRDNNVVTIKAPVVELLIPDLHVANFSALALRNAAGGAVSPAFDADVARYEVTAGELVTFEIKVANDGRAGATNVDVRAFIGALSLPPKTIPYIAPGTEAAVTFNWLAQKGEHELEFLVRSEQVELTSANNRYPGTGVSILTVKGYEIEVTIDDLLGFAEPGASVEVNFSVRNAGNAGEDLQLTATAPSGMRLQLPREGFFLRAGETYSDRARLVLDAEAVAGEQFISIDAVARENPMKVATGRAAVRVNASYGGSVGTVLASGAPPGFAIPIELINEGNSLEPWSVFVRLPAGWTSKEPMPAKVVVPAHGRIVHELFVNVPVTTAPGERVMQVKATMPNGEPREGLAKVSVLPLRAAGVVVGDLLPKPERGTLSVPVVVENRGNVHQPFEMLLVDAPAGLELKIEPSSFELPPGGKAVAALVVKPNASIEAGTYAITSYALFEGVTPQTSEGRANLQTIKVPVVRQDLRLSPLEYSPRAGLDAGDHVTVKVSVTNRGLAELNNVPVHLYVDDVFIEEATVLSIASGARADVTFNWTAVLGVHTLTAVVDPYSDTVDGDRADNAVSTLATVGSDPINGGVAAGRADVPAAGMLGLLAVAGVAILLASRRQRR